MAAPTTYNDIADGLETEGQLFHGKKFFVLQRVPSRQRLLDDIRANGGEVVVLEKLADYVIADHLRPKFCPPGSLSYEFVEKSIKQAALRDPDDHLAGPPLGEAREAGAIHRPTKSSRSAYTAEDDRILFEWVRDSEGAGGLSSGNEIYKRLEAEHPNHTWQSWRDRYLKRLRNRPPSASGPLNVPVASSSKPARVTKATATATATSRHSYSVDELATMFSSDDWEELYAFVDIINSTTGQELLSAWTSWAEFKGKQSVHQWQQYYEKVVLPQWQIDPESKRQFIKEKVERKHQDDDCRSRSTPASEEPEELYSTTAGASKDPKEKTTPISTSLAAQKPAETEVAKFEQLLATTQKDSPLAAYVYFARDKQSSTWAIHPTLDHTSLHRVLIQQWRLLSDEEKAPYIAMNETDKSRNLSNVASHTKPCPDSKLLSSSTARHESPVFLKEMYEVATKRARSHGFIRGHDDDELAGPGRPGKRRKSAGATSTDILLAAQRTATTEPLAPLSETPSQTSGASQSEGTEQKLEDQILSDMAGFDGRMGLTLDNDVEDDTDIATECIESDEHTYMDGHTLFPRDTDESSVEVTPLNSPTPRGPRQQSDFDTQAMLSSPSQAILSTRAGIQNRLPQSQADVDTQRSSSSPELHPESDASTTQSLQEFRRSLNDDDGSRIPHPTQQPYHLYISPTPSSSNSSSNSSTSTSISTSSTASGDPDPPLTADELDLFFQEQHEDGFGDDFIVAALKRTRMRPGLAIQVLEAWGQDKPLPVARGIWAVSDDEAVASGDGPALARLGKFHSVDGWGGVTERLVFLEGLRS